MTAVKVGDRVRVTFEGTQEDDGVGLGKAFKLYAEPDGVLRVAVSIEKIEPPVTVFKPGSVVRGKGLLNTYAIAEDGWIMLTDSKGKRYSHRFIKGDPAREFTSDIFELVEIGDTK